jgi:PAS domain S-box-containing protein
VDRNILMHRSVPTTYVLLVDDRDDKLGYLRELLQGQGYRVEVARQGAEAYQKARENPPDLVISDLRMPAMDDGHTLLRKWKADPLLEEIPFVVYTATYADPEDERLALNLGADAFVAKPSGPEEFIARIRVILASTARSAAAEMQPCVDEEKAILEQYSETLVRKLEEKTAQLEASNRALQLEVKERNEIAKTQIAILDALPARIALIDSAGTIIAVNESWRQFAADDEAAAPELGVGQNYLTACDDARVPYSAQAQSAAAGIREVIRGDRSVFAIEYPYHSPTQERWYRMMVTSLRESAGAVVMHLDITDRKRMEMQLIASQEQSYLLLNSTAEGIYGLDLAGRCTFCNPAAARLLGYDNPNDIVGQSVHDQHHYRHADGSAFVLADCPAHHGYLQGMETHAVDEVFFRKDGSQFPVEYWSHPIRRGADIVGAVVAFLDISERRNLEARFQQSQKMEAVGRLAGGVAHDFNNALQVIIVCCELLDEQLTGRDEARQCVREMQVAAHRGSSLTRQLLAFSRKQVLRPVLLDLNEVLIAMREMLQRMIGEDITLACAYEPDLNAIEADEAQIEQILMNLAVNSRDAMPHGGELLIKTANVTHSGTEFGDGAVLGSRRYVLLSVRDTGIGMDDATQSRIFEPFFTTKEPGKGTGLGLSTVYGIVSQSGGFIDVDSEPGRGTCFDIYFPSARAPALGSAERAQRHRVSGGTEAVLLVEDEDSLRVLISKSLRAHGYKVLEARDGRTALDLAAKPTVAIDLVVSDVILPDISGPQVVSRLVQGRPFLKTLYISGYTDDYISHRRVAKDEPVLLEKPFSIGALLSKIREVLDG